MVDHMLREHDHAGSIPVTQTMPGRPTDEASPLQGDLGEFDSLTGYHDKDEQTLVGNECSGSAIDGGRCHLGYGHSIQAPCSAGSSSSTSLLSRSVGEGGEASS